MNKIIIHISDLHISDHTGVFGRVNENTILNTDSKKSSNFSFIDKFVEKIKSKFPDNEKILLITGDIANLAEQNEYDFATKYISKITSDLSIEKSNLILIPGDHDVHRDSVRNGLRETKNIGKEGYELLEEKFKNFGDFYKTLKDEDFDFNKALFDTRELTGDIILLSANSNFRVGQMPGGGFIPIEQLDNELNDIKAQNKDKQILIAFHHNISGVYENEVSVQWDVENRKDLIHLLDKHQIKCVFYGNEHTHRSTKLDSTEIYISDSGAMSGIKPLGTFKCYEIIKATDLVKLRNYLFTLVNSDSINETEGGDWIDVEPPHQRRNEIDEFVILDNTQILTQQDEIEDLPSSEDEDPLLLTTLTTTTPVYYNNDFFSNGLYEIVKEKKLFHSGHFHWSETSRAHNWIDISKLLESKEDLHFVKDSIVDVIETFDLAKDCDLIIGLGYEGNIISTKASIKYNKP